MVELESPMQFNGQGKLMVEFFISINIVFKKEKRNRAR